MKISIDMGHTLSKFFDGNREFMIPSVLGETQTDLMSENNREEIETEEGRWYIGNTAIEQSVTHITGRDERWAFSPEYRALLLYGLSEYLSPATDNVVVDVALSLPIVDYKRHRPELSSLLKKTHLIERPNRRKLTATVRTIVWLPQGFAPAKPFMGDNKNVVALDFGSRNINTAQFKGRKLINSKTASVEAGAAHILIDIGQRIEERTKRELSEMEIIEAIQSGVVSSFGQPVDVVDIVNERLGYYTRFFESFISDRWGNGASIDTFVAFGGGVIFGGEGLKKRYPQMVVLNNPQFAQVIAMYDYLNRKLG